MIRLYSPADYPKLDDVHPLVRQHLMDYVNGFLAEYNTPDMRDIGCVFLLQSESDIADFKSMGFPQPLDEMLNEYAEVVNLKGETDTVRLIHAVFIISDSWGIDLYIPENLCPDALREHLYKEFTVERTIKLEDC